MQVMFVLYIILLIKTYFNDFIYYNNKKSIHIDVLNVGRYNNKILCSRGA